MFESTYIQDGGGTLVKKVVGGQTTVYVSGIFAENLTTGAITKTYYLGDQRIAVSNDSEIGLIAFAASDTDNADAFVLLNMADHAVWLDVDVVGTDSTMFDVTRTSPDETYVGLGELSLEDGKLTHEAPAGSVTTFLGK